ncbi:MAG: PAS domain S-box protein, partial [Acidobacteriota bacterium]|nr:PAS domain S-box protein [Acidobacteriota bacterium]
MARNELTHSDAVAEVTQALLAAISEPNLLEAQSTLEELAGVFFKKRDGDEKPAAVLDKTENAGIALKPLSVEARYRALVEQIPAVVFMAYLDKGIGEAYVSPQIEAALGFSQSEWLEDPMRWYQQIHADDKQRWSVEAAEMFLCAKPLSSAYRVVSRDGRVRWFHCQAKMIRREDGRPWFIHGVGVDITDLKEAENALQQERNVLSAILDTVGALVIVLEPAGRIVRFNRACEQTTGYAFSEVKGKNIWDLFLPAEEISEFRALMDLSPSRRPLGEHETHLLMRDGTSRLIAWSTTVLPRSEGAAHIIATGIDITERKRLEKAILEVSAREQRRIGQDLHDGLG